MSISPPTRHKPKSHHSGHVDAPEGQDDFASQSGFGSQQGLASEEALDVVSALVPISAALLAPEMPARESAVLAEAEPVWGPWLPDKLVWSNTDWVVVAWMIGMHVGALAAPFYFEWQSLAACFVLHWFTASIGICLGYHRLLSHKSFKVVTPAKFVTMLAGALSGEGSPLVWSATHRLHHHRSDQAGDPHSPLITAIWSHFTWMLIRRTPAQQQALFQKYTPDLVQDPMLQFFEKTYFLWLVASGIALYAIGGMSMLLWGLCMRMVLVYHGTWFVNSATHIWGYRNYDVRDESRNLWWVAIWAYGEGWHNNHHAHPHVAPAGHQWWELDPTWWAIKTLRFFHLAYDVDDRIPMKTTGREPAATT